MSRYDYLISELGNKTIFCNNLGLGEQAEVLVSMPKSIFVCPNVDYLVKIKAQLDALGRENVAVDNFGKMFTLSKFQSVESKLDIQNFSYSFTHGEPIVLTTPEFLFTPIFSLEEFSNHVIKINKSKDYDIKKLQTRLVEAGYKKVDAVTAVGEFAVRGDLVDIFGVSEDNPIRIDFFDTSVEDMYYFDYISFEKKNRIEEFFCVPNRQVFLKSEKKEKLLDELEKIKNDNEILTEIYSAINRDEDVPVEFLVPFVDNIKFAIDLEVPIIISNVLQTQTIYEKTRTSIEEKIEIIFGEKIKKIYKNAINYLKVSDFYGKNAKKLVFFDNFNLNNSEILNYFDNKISFDFKTINLSSYLNNLEKLVIETQQYLDKKIFLCLSSKDTFNQVKKIFEQTHASFTTNKNSSGIILTELDIPYNICFADSDKMYIGSTNFAHKKELKQTITSTIKYLPKPGEYVVHSTHGIGRCEGIVNMNVSGVDKEFFRLVYRGGDILYVPFENADCLSLYMAEGDVRLNKLGGKEFFNMKERAVKSIEDMSGELLELYAKRKAVKGFKYLEDDYLYTEFENSFEYEETADQLQAIADIKNDMVSGKVMDRLVCGDVGFGKTEVAMRALFKAVESGKQVAILAPTTILSLQHYMTASKRTKDFGVKVEMLNRFKSPKEQKAILEDLKTGKINVICGTHRILSNDVVFDDLGLLILDEEQRFGVKAKEQIKQMKNNVNVLTLSATPIPRTLSMTLMSIRDISIINTPPVDRLPVKTYVIAYNDEIIANAINEEINRGGQVLVVYNNIDNIYTLASRLKDQTKNDKAIFDVAHGQMSEIALENAVKRLYDKETNVFVSTTLIENGVDLPSANTLIVIDSDKLGLSQMYQLRGRVGRSDKQAYAYFTYNKNKTLSEDSTSRLQAIAENTELGSGFKIAMRDLQIRGAGELLGKTQHGHMIKIGYDMYSRLLNETLRRLRGEKVETERDAKIDVAISSKIPYDFVSDDAERLKIIAKISNIVSKDGARKVLNDLLNQYGKLPKEIYQLANIALMKSLAQKQKIKQILVTKTKINMVYYSDVDIEELLKKVNRFKHFKFEKGIEPTVALPSENFNVATAMSYIIEFLNA